MQRSRTWWLRLLGGVMFALVAISPALAQSGAVMTLRVSKIMGINMGTQVQGIFKLSVSGPDDLQSVTFTLDGNFLGEYTTPPFELRINTDHYAPGWHTFGAWGITASGQRVEAEGRRFQFVTAEEGWKAVQRIILPVMVLVVGMMLVGALLTFLGGKGQTQAEELPATYGLLGGTICPACGRPYARHWWGLNLVTGKLDRCPYCGSWRLTRRASPAELEQAARAWRERQNAPAGPSSPKPDLEEELDASRYTDLI